MDQHNGRLPAQVQAPSISERPPLTQFWLEPGVTNSGPTTINGSLGTSPTGTLTGAPTVTGSTDLANPAAAAAKLALTAAYNDAAARSLNAISLPGDLSGLTLAPGLYTNSTSVMLSAGNVTLDAQGNPNATWIFQMGSTLTTIGRDSGHPGWRSQGRQYLLAGWQFGHSWNDIDLQREHPGRDIHFGEYRRGCRRQITDADRRSLPAVEHCNGT